MSKKVPGKKIFAVIIAYNAEKTIENVINEIPLDWVDDIVINDDCSTDHTYDIIKKIPHIKALRNKKNIHMGGNQKVIYDYALSNGADIIVLLHGDNQYDASMIPSMIEPILNNTADAVLGSRILGGKALEGGMPLYKYFANHLLNFIQNSVYQHKLSDYATGYKAYSNKLLTSIPYHLNRDDFIFDEQLNTQMIYFKFRLSQVGIPTRYFKEASSVNFFTSVYYGLWTLLLMLQFTLSKSKVYIPKFLSKTN